MPRLRHLWILASPIIDADASCQSARAGLVNPEKRESILDYPWSSVAFGYGRPPSKRPAWLEVETELELQSSAGKAPLAKLRWQSSARVMKAPLGSCENS